MRLKQLLGILLLLSVATATAAAAGPQLTQVRVASQDSATTVNQDSRHRRLFQIEIGSRLDDGFHPELISFFVALNSWRSNRGTLRSVKHAELDSRCICV